MPDLHFSIPPMLLAILIVILDVGWRTPQQRIHAVDLVLLAGAGWLATHAFEIGTPDLANKIFWNKLQFITIITIPIAWYLGTQTYIIAGKHNRYRRIYIFVFLATALALIVTNDLHELLWSNERLNPLDPYDQLITDQGSAYWIFIGIAYYLVMISLIPFARSAYYYRNLYGKQAVLLLTTALLPVLGSILDLLRIELIPTIETTPLAFAISRMLNIRVNSQLRVGDIVPVVREVTIDNINNGIIVIDSENIILDHNPAAAKIIQQPGESLIGQPIGIIWDEHFEISWEEFSPLLNASQIASIRTTYFKPHTYQVTSNPVQLRPNHIRGSVLLLNDISTSIDYEEKIKTSLQDKELLLQEIHHYIRNNLQIVSSLAGLLAHKINDQSLQKIYEESQNRIQAMALIHDKLYQTKSLVEIEFGEYISDLVSLLIISQNSGYGNTQFHVTSDEIVVDIDTGIACGLILNELVSNSIKHAFPNGVQGEIRVTARENPIGWLCLRVSDNGVGLPDGFDLQKSQSLGLKLVETLSFQLNGEILIDRRGGATFILECPISS